MSDCMREIVRCRKCGCALTNEAECEFQGLYYDLYTVFDLPRLRGSRDSRNGGLLIMSDWKREVDYATYCPKCKSFKVLETDEPCNECMTECVREGTAKPVKFEEAKVKIK